MKPSLWLAAALLATPAVGAPPSKAPAKPPSKVAASGPAYDAELTGYAYPFDVRYRRFTSQGQALRMAYMDVRPKKANGHAVLLLHGKNFSGAYWERTIRALTERGYRVVVPDQIGFGKSSKPRAYQFSFHALATQTKELLDALSVEKVSVVGHSMGGMLATRFALMFPGRTEQLVLVNPIGLEDYAQHVPYQTVDAWYASELAGTPEGVKQYMKQAYFDGKWRDAYDPLVEIQAGWRKGPDKERIAWVSALTYDMIFTQPVVDDFPNVKVPTGLIIGDRDKTALGRNLAPPEVAKTLGDYETLGETTAKAIPNARLVEIEGVGHVPQVEAFEPYIKALLGFLPAGDR